MVNEPSVFELLRFDCIFHVCCNEWKSNMDGVGVTVVQEVLTQDVCSRHLRSTCIIGCVKCIYTRKLRFHSFLLWASSEKTAAVNQKKLITL